MNKDSATPYMIGIKTLNSNIENLNLFSNKLNTN